MNIQLVKLKILFLWVIVPSWIQPTKSMRIRIRNTDSLKNRWLTQELGIPALEEALSETPATLVVDRGLNHTEVVAGIADRLAAKADRYLAALDRLAVALRDSEENQGTSVAALDSFKIHNLKAVFRIRIRRISGFFSIRIRNYLSWSGSFHQQAKQAKKFENLDLYSFELLKSSLSLKTNVNVSSVSTK